MTGADILGEWLELDCHYVMDAWDQEGNFPDFSLSRINSQVLEVSGNPVVRVRPELGSEFSSEYELDIRSKYSSYASCSTAELEQQTAATYPDNRLKNSSISPRQSDCQQLLEVKDVANGGSCHPFRADGKMSEPFHFLFYYNLNKSLEWKNIILHFQLLLRRNPARCKSHAQT
jgi:hypothetical protein